MADTLKPKDVGVPAWPTAWSFPPCQGALAVYELRTFMLKDLDRRLPDLLTGSDLDKLEAVLRALSPAAADALERSRKEERSGAICRGLQAAVDRELELSMPARWQMANDSVLPINAVFGLLDPRIRLSQLGRWLEQIETTQPDDARLARRLIRDYADALEPAEVAVARLGIPTERPQRIREEVLARLDEDAPGATVHRATKALYQAWETICPRLIALANAQPTLASSTTHEPPPGSPPDIVAASASRLQEAIVIKDQASRPAEGSEQAAGAGVPAWPSRWPLPQASGPLARFTLRTAMLREAERRLSHSLPHLAGLTGDAAESARSDIEAVGAILTSLCASAARALVHPQAHERYGFISRLLREAIDDEFRRSIGKRWRMADGPPLPVDDLWPLLNPRVRVAQLGTWLGSDDAGPPEKTSGERRTLRHYTEAMEPAEVAVARLGLPIERSKAAREELLRLLDREAPGDEIARSANAVNHAWEALLPRLKATKPERPRMGLSAPAAPAAEPPGHASTGEPSGSTAQSLQSLPETEVPASSTALGLPVGLTVGNFISSGGFAEVWRGEDSVRAVAVKFFNAGAEATELAVRHARALALVDHPNVVKVHYTAVAKHPKTGATHQCVVMELVEGQTLDAWLQSAAPPVALDVARRLGAEIIEAVTHIHAAGTFHGDLHAGNVLIATGEKVKVIDIYSSGSLRLLSTGPRDIRLNGDLTGVAGLCVEILHAAQVAVEAVGAFGAAAWRRGATLQDIRAAFEEATADPASTVTVTTAPRQEADRDALLLLHALTRDGPMRGELQMDPISLSGSRSYSVVLGPLRLDLNDDPRTLARLIAAINVLESAGLLSVSKVVQNVPVRAEVTDQGWTVSDSLEPATNYWWQKA